jgi:hypothetical protein
MCTFLFARSRFIEEEIKFALASKSAALFGQSTSSSGETAANFALVFGKIAADVGDAERAKDRSVRLALEQKAEALFDQALRICFATDEVLDIANPGGDGVERRLRGGYFDFVNVCLLFLHANRWWCWHAASTDAATKRAKRKRYQTIKGPSVAFAVSRTSNSTAGLEEAGEAERIKSAARKVTELARWFAGAAKRMPLLLVRTFLNVHFLSLSKKFAPEQRTRHNGCRRSEITDVAGFIPSGGKNLTGKSE